MFSGMDSGSQMEIVKPLRIGVMLRHSTTLHLRKSRLREPDLRTMKDNAGKWNRDEQFRVFLLFVAINILSANSRANASIHLRLDHDNLSWCFDPACTRMVSLARIRALMKL